MLSVVVFLAATLNVSAKVKIDSSNISNVAVNGTESNMDSVLYQDGKEVLKSIKTAGGAALGNGYDIVVKQQLVYSIEYLFVGILCLICGYLFFVFYKKTEKDKPNTVIPSLLFLGLTIWTAVVFSLHWHQVLQGFVNPDYAAINDIIRMFKQGSGR